MLEINAIDKSKYVNENSLKIENILTRQVDTCTFQIISHTGHEYKPEIGDEVVVYDRGEKIFAGNIIKITEAVQSYKCIIYNIECKDYTDLMDSKLVVKTYSKYTVAQIIEDIKDNYMPAGFTTTNVVCTKTVDYVGFNYEQPSKCLQILADLVSYDWYVDYDKDIHFFAKESNSAPFNLEDDNNSYIFNSLKINKNKSQLRNVIYVRGGEYLGNTITADQIADGTQAEFWLPYKFSGIKVFVDGVEKTVGVDYINTFDDYECLYNFEQKLVRFPDGSKPTNGQTFRVSGNPYLPVLVKVRDNASVSQYGDREYKIIDNTIKTKQGARERAKAELEAYKSNLVEASFKTIKNGLRSGQYINVQSDSRNIDEDYLINKVVMKLWSIDKFIYDVFLVSFKTFGIIEFLQMILMGENAKIKVNPDEILDVVESVYEDLNIADSLAMAITSELPGVPTLTETLTAYYHTPPFKWAPWSKKSFKFRWGLSEWS